MKLASVKYLVGEGFKNTWTNRLMSIASVGVLVACMVVIGLTLLISENVSNAIGNLKYTIMGFYNGDFFIPCYISQFFFCFW